MKEEDTATETTGVGGMNTVPDPLEQARRHEKKTREQEQQETVELSNLGRGGSGKSPAELVFGAQAFKRLTGRNLTKGDLTAANRRRFKKQTGIELVGQEEYKRVFGSWLEFMTVCGFVTSNSVLTQEVGNRAIQHCIDELGFTPEEFHQSITDGWLPDGRTCEVKGCTLLGQKFIPSVEAGGKFSWMTHARNLSISADLLILVGMGKNLEPICRLEIPKEDMQHVVDGKRMVSMYSAAIWGTKDSPLRRYVKWYVPMSERELSAKHIRRPWLDTPKIKDSI